MTVLLSNEILMPRSLLQDPCSADLSAALLVAGLSLAGFPKETRQRVTAGSPSMQSVLSSYLFEEARCWLGQPLQARLGLSSLYRHLLSLSFYLCLSLSALTPHQLISPSALDSGVLLGTNWAKTVLLHSQAWNRANYNSFQHDQLQRTCFWRNFSIARTAGWHDLCIRSIHIAFECWTAWASFWATAHTCSAWRSQKLVAPISFLPEPGMVRNTLMHSFTSSYLLITPPLQSEPPSQEAGLELWASMFSHVTPQLFQLTQAAAWNSLGVNCPSRTAGRDQRTALGTAEEAGWSAWIQMRRTGHASELGEMVPGDKVAETLGMVKCGMLRRSVGYQEEQRLPRVTGTDNLQVWCLLTS